MPGYSGGHVPNPSYEEVYTDTTGHAEVCQITFNPAILPFARLLEIFWKVHDPTTLNRQGEDVGSRYRSVIFYHTPEQKKTAFCLKQKLEESGIWKNKIVTEIKPFSVFYKAEGYHHEYYNNNPQNKYCSLVITPKIEKFTAVFRDYLK
jgi:peptide-methionine (S)-S-oxide reductase